MNNIYAFIIFALVLVGCNGYHNKENPPIEQGAFVQVLGIAQDAGYPQAGCQKSCCLKHYSGDLRSKMTSCIAIIDPATETYWIIDATPDFREQLHLLQSNYADYSFGGIFLTHAHVGHYTGLIHLGREVMGSKKIPVYTMPRMSHFLKNNGPWSQLVTLNNIDLVPILSDSTIELNNKLVITPLLVPHRDEFSETVGYKVSGVSASLLFIPDIDKWNKWDRNILDEIQSVDHALLDGTFYQNGEIPGRDMALIPHPFIEESLQLFDQMDKADRAKVKFIHFNHTNPVLDPSSVAYKTIINNGFSIAYEGEKLPL